MSLYAIKATETAFAELNDATRSMRIHLKSNRIHNGLHNQIKNILILKAYRKLLLYFSYCYIAALYSYDIWLQFRTITTNMKKTKIVMEIFEIIRKYDHIISICQTLDC